MHGLSGGFQGVRLQFGGMRFEVLLAAFGNGGIFATVTMSVTEFRGAERFLTKVWIGSGNLAFLL
jgi:hypothetical protein